MTDLNQNIHFPYGDAFIIGSPHVDQTTQYLLQEQRQRELQRQKNADAINAEFKGLVSGVRTGDTQKLANLWSDYKNSWIQLQKNPPKNQADYLKAQQNLLQKKAAVYNHVTASKEKAVDEKRVGGLIASDKTNQFKDNAYDILKQGMQLPYDQQLEVADDNGQKTKIDWTNTDALKRHIDTKGVMDAIKYSTGTPQKYSGDKYKENKTDLQFIQPEITAGNNPAAFKSNMMLAATKDPTSFLNTLPHPTDEEYFNTVKNYNAAMADGKLKKNWKMNEDLDLSDAKSDLEKAINYQTMTYALNPNNQPRVTNKTVPDQEAAMNKRQRFSMLMQDRGFANNKVLFGMREEMKDKPAQEKADYVNTFVEDLKKNGVNSTAPIIGETGGKELNVSPVILQQYKMPVINDQGKQITTTPTSLTYLPNGNYLIQGNGIKHEFTEPEFKADLINKLFPTAVKTAANVHANKPAATKPANNSNKWDKYKVGK
jgi:hypothetical protein